MASKRDTPLAAAAQRAVTAASARVNPRRRRSVVGESEGDAMPERVKSRRPIVITVVAVIVVFALVVLLIALFGGGGGGAGDGGTGGFGY
jgi:hypothetical protein